MNEDSHRCALEEDLSWQSKTPVVMWDEFPEIGMAFFVVQDLKSRALIACMCGII